MRSAYAAIGRVNSAGPNRAVPPPQSEPSRFCRDTFSPSWKEGRAPGGGTATAETYAWEAASRSTR
ncbi:hypothetical protein LUX05_07820 [Streptomyces somaliensis]|nr:hypothetical protein [Streptomyces somaliensis]MCP9974098.1 hypothetical protein [Streptomyces somaliensis]